MKQPDTYVPVDPVTGFPVTPPPLYAPRDPSTLEPHYSAHVSAMTTEGLHAKSLIAAELAWRDQRIAQLEARWEKYTDPGVAHPPRAPARIWVQWMPRLRNAVVYLQAPAILDGTTGCYVLSSATSSPAKHEGSPFCLECGHPLTEADRQAPVCPYCGVP